MKTKPPRPNACSWIGVISQRDVVPVLLSGLQRLSPDPSAPAGLLLLDPSGAMLRCAGPAGSLSDNVGVTSLSGTLGLAWLGGEECCDASAVDGPSGRVALVMPGAAESVAGSLRHELAAGRSLVEAVRALRRGDAALGAIAATEPDCLVVARGTTSLLIGVGEGEQIAVTDEKALPPELLRVIEPEPGDVAALRRDDLGFVDGDGQTVVRPIVQRPEPPSARPQSSVAFGGFRFAPAARAR